MLPVGEFTSAQEAQMSTLYVSGFINVIKNKFMVL